MMACSFIPFSGNFLVPVWWLCCLGHLKVRVFNKCRVCACLSHHNKFPVLISYTEHISFRQEFQLWNLALLTANQKCMIRFALICRLTVFTSFHYSFCHWESLSENWERLPPMVDVNITFKKREYAVEQMKCSNPCSSRSRLLSSIFLWVTLREVSRHVYYQLIIVKNREQAAVCIRTVTTRWNNGWKTRSTVKTVYRKVFPWVFWKEPAWVNVSETTKKSKLHVYKYAHDYIFFTETDKNKSMRRSWESRKCSLGQWLNFTCKSTFSFLHCSPFSLSC